MGSRLLKTGFLVFVSAAGMAVAQAPAASGLVANDTRPQAVTPDPSLAPPVPLSAEKRADIFMARKMYRDAIELYKEGSDQSSVLLNKIGIAYHQLLDLNAARKYYEKSLKVNPKYAEAMNNLGTIHYARKSFRRAISYYKRAVRLAPNSASVQSNLGTAYFARKQYKEAAECYQAALKLDPEVFEHRSTVGVMLQERSVEERAKFHYYLAKTYAQAGATDRALQYLRKAIEEGFKEKNKMREDPEFAEMRALPEFQDLLKAEPKVL